LVAVLVLPGLLGAAEWAEQFRAWHGANEFRGIGASSSAVLAWWESYLLQAYLPMYKLTGDGYWLDRFVTHADAMFRVARDTPEADEFWPGYRDSFLGWGTTRYEPTGRYQEYMVHDGRICLPVVRFIRMVYQNPALHDRYLRRARHYLTFIEQNVIAKWHQNLDADRGSGEDLEHFGGWLSLPLNQFLSFGEVLLVLADVARLPEYEKAYLGLPDRFYVETAEAMAARFKGSLLYRTEDDAFIWRQSPGADAPWEDISHADLCISFALEAHRQGRVFSGADMKRFGHGLVRTMRRLSGDQPGFCRLVNGTGGLDRIGNLRHWLQLAEFEPEVRTAVEQAYRADPAWTSAAQAGPQMALTMVQLAEYETGSAGARRLRLSPGKPGWPDATEDSPLPARQTSW
jgi:hypothetical protein